MTSQSPESSYNKKNPYSSALLVNQVLTEGSDKETRHFEFSLQGSGLTYEPGDSLGVVPTNCPDLIDDLLQTTGFTGSEKVTVGESESELRFALLHQLACTVLSKIQIKKFNEIAKVQALDELLKIENKQDLIDYMWGRELIDLFKEFPQPSLNKDDFVGLLRPMPPRLYSIASSLSAHLEEVHLTVAVVRYDTHGRKRKGVCSSYLAERVGNTIPCYFHPNKNFKLPEESDKPIIMVGPGTGIAPFRAFIEERKINGSSGKNWLFFGNRFQKTDYLYGDEWQRYQKDGSLHRLDLAWSRDQEDKVYVQHKMLEMGKELWKWLEDGAIFYVCGDASRMAKDVDQALRTIAQEHGTMSEDDSSVWIKSLQKERRYLKDVY